MEEKDGVCPKSDRTQIDPRLQPLIEADDQQYQVLLDHLIKDHAEPLVYKIISSKLNLSQSKGFGKTEYDDAKDLCQDSIIKLIAQLKQLRMNSSKHAISALDDFVAKVTFNVYNNYLRLKYPLRHKLKRRLEHLLKSRKEFSSWKVSSDRVAGFALWRGLKWQRDNIELSAQLRQDPQLFMLSQFGEKPANQITLDLLLTKLFDWTNQPVEFDALVNLVAELYGIKDVPPDGWQVSHKNQPASDQNSEGEIQKTEHRQYLQLAWREILALPIRQRYALLLNLKDSDGDGVVNALILGGIASAQTIAEALEMNQTDLEKIWDKLPLKDAVIGNMLGGLSSQAVINLRKSARERLARRMNKTRTQSSKP